MNTNVLRAVFSRNLVAYFANPTGYLFICVFVVLSSFWAFWPSEFFNANLANLDQLSKVFPFIMLIFIPAITMSVWAEERRQGTDELLLTIPAGDFDIVLGKYLAAVAIYSVSLAFSLVCNFAMLWWLSKGQLDGGLFFGTYVGYWFIGLAMLAIGMVASFLTANLTIGFILGAAFNAPLVFAALAQNFLPQDLGRTVEEWSIGGQFADFGRGILSLSGIVYFTAALVVMLYLSMVLIGRRHWARSGEAAYFLLRIVLLVVALVISLVVSFAISLLISLVVPTVTASLFSMIGLFAVILVMTLYLSIVLIRRPDRTRNRMWPTMADHFAVRTVSLIVLAVAASLFFQLFDVRIDATTEKLSSLSKATKRLISDLELTRPIKVEAFISPSSDVPEAFVQSRLNLLSMLRELQSRGGGRIQVQIHNTERFSDEADRAEERFNIMPRSVLSQSRGTMSQEEIFMGVAITCGLEKVILPFIGRGIPIEYELVRSICTVSQQKRRRIGVLQTDAQLYGSFNMQTMSSSQNWPIITELEKMYEVVQVDASSPITERYDALLAVQPSSLGPDQMSNFIAAVRSGQPTAIFEDPFPGFAGNVPATTAPRRAPGGQNPMMMMGRQPAPEKGDIGQLWNLLGVDFGAHQIIWQNYNPYPLLRDLPPELVFVDRSSESDNTFNEKEDISSRLEMLLFPFPGSISQLKASSLNFEPLVQTGSKTGIVNYDEMFRRTMFGGQGGLDPNRPMHTTNTSYILAAHIRGKLAADQPMADEGETPEANESDGHEGHDPAPGDPHAHDNPIDMSADDMMTDMADVAAEDLTGEAPVDAEINVVLVADIDMFHRQFFMLRESGDNPEAGVDFNFDNVTFVLNILDVLADDEHPFVEIRKRRPKHRTLVRVDDFKKEAAQRNSEAREKLEKKLGDVQDEMQTELNNRMDKLREDMRERKIDDQEIGRRFGLALSDGQRRMQQKVDQLQRANSQELKEIEKQQDREIRRVQDDYKMLAVFLPLIPPLLLALAVFFARRGREREGVDRSRLR